jgi:hypothetical protein
MRINHKLNLKRLLENSSLLEDGVYTFKNPMPIRLAFPEDLFDGNHDVDDSEVGVLHSVDVVNGEVTCGDSVWYISPDSKCKNHPDGAWEIHAGAVIPIWKDSYGEYLAKGGEVGHFDAHQFKNQGVRYMDDYVEELLYKELLT